MPHSTGHLSDHLEVVKTRRGLHFHPSYSAMMAGVASLPMTTNNRAKLMPAQGGPGVLDQDGTGSCEGHAHGAGGTLLLACKGQSQGLISPTMLYLGALMCDSTLQPDGTLSPITDTGTMPSSILNAWSTFGAQLAKDDPQYPCTTQAIYADPNNSGSLLILPTVERLYQASPYRFQGAYFLMAAGPQKLLGLLVALAAGYPVSDAIPASGDGFQNYTSGVLGMLTGPVDHANLIMDYVWLGTAAQWTQYVTALSQNNTTALLPLDQYLTVICLNSWSETWGQGDAVAECSGGTYQANTVYLAQAEDLCALELSAAA